MSTTGIVAILIDSGSCMERRERFEEGRRFAKQLARLAVSRGFGVLLGLWWSEGLVPLCIGGDKCIDAVDEYAVIGGRGCWDYALLETTKLVSIPAYAVIIGCCRSACSRFWSVPSVYKKTIFYCLAGFSERIAKRLAERGVIAASNASEVLRLLAWG